MLVRSIILTLALILGASLPGITLAQTSATPTEVPVSSDQPVDPGADVTAPPDTSLPTLPAAVPLPMVDPGAWTPALRTMTTGCASVAGLPDAACTPGAVDPRVTQDTIASTICTSGYTATVRPPVSVTNRIKREQMAAYGLQGQPLSAYELDHLISLELGGAPADVANLWPESWTGDGNAHQKDAVETHLKREVCAGAITLIEAQRMIATDWYAVFNSNALQPAP